MKYSIILCVVNNKEALQADIKYFYHEAIDCIMYYIKATGYWLFCLYHYSLELHIDSLFIPADD